MIGAFFIALWRSVCIWVRLLAERALNWIAFRLMDAGDAIHTAGVDLSEVADAVGDVA